MKRRNIYIVLSFVFCCVILVVWLSLEKVIDGKRELTSLFTGFAFVVTCASLISQKNELNSQRKFIMQQQFENTFHFMLNQLRFMVDNIEYGQNWFRGKSVFKDCYNSLKHRNELYKDNKDFLEILNCFVLEADYKLLENYFNYLYQLLLYLDEPKFLSFESKQNYANILRSQLTTYELLMLFYHLRSSNANKNFIEIVHKYKILKNLEMDFLITIQDKDSYNKLINNNSFFNYRHKYD